MPAIVFVIGAGGWLAWVMPFFLLNRNRAAPQQRDRRARWGIVLEGIGFALVWQPALWRGAPGLGRMAASVVLMTAAATLSWTSARTLGRQWRFDAGLNADHQLIQSGAYRLVRHPIYTSMFCLLLGWGLLLSRLPILALAIAFFITGTEIRIRIEDRLLAERFGDAFRAYRDAVPAYLPFSKGLARRAAV